VGLTGASTQIVSLSTKLSSVMSDVTSMLLETLRIVTRVKGVEA